ncbi:DUF948 domain-containing protein [Paenibacillus sp. CAA11]|uniref:DUF948 domain-containing protein n=1 Tax=Paenibacillus sp. CAA11 TaxID=1532905 RepID=UPI000D38AF12|nr:DUF948 domain-containing protein [Paenibacillus sp. CAA11]AWB47045.1 DUF948 domain-containing protein [Paenibacillus sp. CAA11]
MSLIWQLSVALIAVAFAALVVYLIKTLKAAETSLDKTSQTLQEVQKTIDELSYEVKQVLRQANGITEDVQHKMKQIDPVLETVKNVGDVLNEVTLAAKQVSTTLIERFKKSSTEHKVKADPKAAANAAVQTPSDRTLNSYAAVQPNASASGSKAGWMKWVDVAAGLWQKYRS